MVEHRVKAASDAAMVGKQLFQRWAISEDGDTLMVNDPGFSTSNYSYTGDCVGFRLFDMTA